jgi:hypothetical protein
VEGLSYRLLTSAISCALVESTDSANEVRSVQEASNGVTRDVRLKTIWRLDRKRSVAIVKRGELFSFEEDGEQFESDYAYWGPVSCGGLFETAVEAEGAAIMEIPWLREQN